MKAYREPENLPQERILKTRLGNFTSRWNPKLEEDVKKEPFSGVWGVAGRLVRNTILLKAVQNANSLSL